jgi:hypothetical protein
MTRETDALRKPFLIGVLLVVIVVVLLGGLIALFGSTDDRPEGVAERWLTAVSDLTRKGVHDDAVKRVAAHGDVSLSEGLLAGVEPNDKSAFTTLEVGKGLRSNVGTTLVPAKLVQRGSDKVISEVLELTPGNGTWRVTRVVPGDPTVFRVPSDGGDVAAKAPLGLYAVALLIGVGVAAAASALVRAAGREHERLLDA